TPPRQVLRPFVELGFLRGDVFTRTFLKLTRSVFVEAFDGGDLLLINHRQLLDRAEAFGSKKLSDHLVQIERIDENLGAVLELGLAALRLLLLGQDIDVPASELRGEPHVLTASADRQRELLVRHNDLNAFPVFIKHDLCHLGRRQRVDDKSSNVGRPRNNVDLFALQFVHHRLDARTPHANAGANGVDRRIARDHRDLGARTGITGNRLDFDNPVVNFRHLLREQPGSKVRVRARQENLRTARLATHVIDIGADAIAVTEDFARQQFVASYDRLAAAEIDNNVAILHTLDDAV